MNNISDISSKYQYQTYADKINETQKFRLKLYIMPKLKIKQLKYQDPYTEKYNLSKSSPKFKGNTNEIKTLKKNFFSHILWNETNYSAH